MPRADGARRGESDDADGVEEVLSEVGERVAAWPTLGWTQAVSSWGLACRHMVRISPRMRVVRTATGPGVGMCHGTSLAVRWVVAWVTGVRAPRAAPAGWSAGRVPVMDKMAVAAAS